MNLPIIFQTKYYKFLTLLVFCSTIVIGQENKKLNNETKFWDNVYFGGGLGLGFGNGYTNIGLSPNAIYRFDDFFAAGIGLNGNYSSSSNNFEATVLGASVIGLFQPVTSFQCSLELEQNNVNFDDKVFNEKRNYWYTALYIGAGYAIGNFGAVGIRYDILYKDTKSVYATAFMPFVRVFF